MKLSSHVIAILALLVIISHFELGVSGWGRSRRRRRRSNRASTAAPSTTTTTTATTITTTQQPSTTAETCKEFEQWKTFIGETEIPGLTVKTCGDSIYDDYAQHCCGGTVYNRKPFHGCCGGKLFGTYTNKCVDDQVVAKTFVCGTKTYFAPTEFCFNDAVYKIRNDVVCDGKVHQYINPGA